MVSELLNWFGPNRLMWGSDWPVLNLASTYKQWRELSNALLSELDADETTQIFASTAKEFYHLSNGG